MTTSRLEQIADLQRAKLGDQLRIGPYLGTYYYAVKHRQGAVGQCQSCATRICRWRSTATSRREDRLGRTRCCRAIRWCRRASRATTPRRSHSYADMSQIDREDEAPRKSSKSSATRPDKPLKIEIRYNTCGEPQEHRRRDRRSSWKPHRRRGDLAQHRRQDPLRLTSSRRAISTSPAPAGSPTTTIPQTFLVHLARPASGNNYSDFNNAEDTTR